MQAKSKEPPSSALPKFAEAFTSFKRFGSLATVKEACTGKSMTKWEQGVSKADNRSIWPLRCLRLLLSRMKKKWCVHALVHLGVDGLLMARECRIDGG